MTEEEWEFQFFPSPKALADFLVDAADLEEGDDILEPSAGDGSIADVIRERGFSVDCCELMPDNQIALATKEHNIVCGDFLLLRRYAHYNKIIANPPFSQGRDLKHIKRMYALLKHPGRIVSVMTSRSYEQNLDWFIKVNADVVRVSGYFPDISISMRVVTIEK